MREGQGCSALLAKGRGPKSKEEGAGSLYLYLEL